MLSRLGFALIVIAFASPAFADSPLGVWLTKGGLSHVEISQCGDKLCGKIIWLKEPNNKDGTIKLDTKNPDPKKRSQKILGLAILSDFVKDGEDYWSGGRIYNPQDGDTYRCSLTLRKDGTLRVRGYVLVPALGKTQIWKRVH